MTSRPPKVWWPTMPSPKLSFYLISSAWLLLCFASRSSPESDSPAASRGRAGPRTQWPSHARERGHRILHSASWVWRDTSHTAANDEAIVAQSGDDRELVRFLGRAERGWCLAMNARISNTLAKTPVLATHLVRQETQASCGHMVRRDRAILLWVWNLGTRHRWILMSGALFRYRILL